MLESLETQNAPGLAAIDAFMRGPSIRLCSSSTLGWEGVDLEHHRALPVERKEAVSGHHTVALFTNHARGEKAASPSRYVPYSFFPGAINLLPAGPLDACRPFTDTVMIVCALDPELVREVEEEEEVGVPSTGGLRPITNVRDRAVECIVSLLTAEANSGGVSGKLFVEHLARALAVRFRQLCGGLEDRRPSQSGKMPARILQRVLDRMRADFANNLDLHTIAQESGYSRTHFLRMFRASMGYSPHDWLTRLRIEEAKTRLQKKAYSLVDIALDCGFSSHGHFSSTFRKIVGVSPRDYRRHCDLVP
jgi:AraC family transcriptional regulator